MRINIFVLTAIFVLIMPVSFAEVIILRNGKVIDGKIIEKTDQYIKINVLDIPLTYYLDEVESIDGQEIVSKSSKDNSLPVSEAQTKPPKINTSPRPRQKDKLSLGQIKEAQEFFQKGLDFFKEKKYDDATAEFQKALELNPNLAEAYYGLGYSYSSNKKFQEAVDSFKKAIELSPKYIDAYNAMAYTFSLMGQYADSIDYYQKALEIKPTSVEACNGIAYSYASLGKFTEAEDYFKKAIQLNPQYIPAYNGLGILYYSVGRYPQAKENFLKSRELMEKNKDSEGIMFIEEYLKKIP